LIHAVLEQQVLAIESAQSVALFDERPFFEKALAYGIAQGVLDAARLQAMQAEAPKGLVQIARYFGSEFLRPELEKARARFVNLISLNLELQSAGKLHAAAQMLRDNSLLSRSKAASDMLKQLIAMPQSSHFGMQEAGGFADEHIPLLAKWSLRTLHEYQQELALREQVAVLIDAALWFAERWGMDAQDLQEIGCDAEALIRTALLAAAAGQTAIPDWVVFQNSVAVLRKQAASPKAKPRVLALPKELPAQFKAAVEAVRVSVQTDLPKILDKTLPARKLFDQTPAFMGRYFWIEDGLSEVDDFDRAASAAWNKATGGHSDDSSLLTLFICLAAGSPPKTLLTAKAAATLVRKIRKSGFQPAQVQDFIVGHAPAHIQQDCLSLWHGFLQDASSRLQSDHDYDLSDAMALLRRDCNIA
jgi:hypothetical protein